MSRCNHCTKSGDKVCGGCRNVHYCSVTCQRADWNQHKKQCKIWRNQAKQKKASKSSAVKPIMKSHDNKQNLSDCGEEQPIALDNIYCDLFYAIASFLGVESIVNLQTTNAKLFKQCQDPNIYKNVPIRWNVARYVFNQNLCSSLFDKVETLQFCDERTCEKDIKLKKEHIDCNINRHWAQSVKTLEFVINSSIANAELQFLKRLPKFHNIENMTFDGTGHKYHRYIFLNKLHYLPLRKLYYGCGEIDNDFLSILPQCINLEQLSFDENYIILPVNNSKYTLYKQAQMKKNAMSTKALLEKIKLTKLAKIYIRQPDFAEEYGINYAYEIAIHLIKTANQKIDLELDFIEVCNTRHAQLLFGDKNCGDILPQLQSLKIVGCEFMVIELLDLLAEGMLKHKAQNYAKRIEVEIDMEQGIGLSENKDKIIKDIPTTLLRLLTLANVKKFKISFFLFVKEFMEHLLMETRSFLVWMEKSNISIYKMSLFEIDMIADCNLLGELLFRINQNKRLVDSICDNLVINIVGIPNDIKHEFEKMFIESTTTFDLIYHAKRQCFTTNPFEFKEPKRVEEDEWDMSQQLEYLNGMQQK